MMNCTCPICFNSMENDSCINCGYKKSMDYSLVMTLGKPVPEAKTRAACHRMYIDRLVEDEIGKRLAKMENEFKSQLDTISEANDNYLSRIEESYAQRIDALEKKMTDLENSTAKIQKKPHPDQSDRNHADQSYPRRDGGKIYFGRYKTTAMGQEETIKWLVLAEDDEKLLLISEMGLDCLPYNKLNRKVKWDTSTLRKFLNEEFLQEAFSEKQISMIQTNNNENLMNSRYLTEGCGYTKDQVFLLSIEEAEKYFGKDRSGRCVIASPYARHKGALADVDTGNSWWWLRSPGVGDELSAYVLTDGNINYGGTYVSNTGGVVRPAIYIDKKYLT